MLACTVGLGADQCGEEVVHNEQGFVTAQVVGDMRFAGVTRAGFDAALDEVCGPGGPTQLGESRLARWPYLQQVTASSAELLWTTKSQEPVTLEVLDAEGAVISKVQAELDAEADVEGAHQFVARVEDLPADSVLCYRLVGPDAELVQSTGFRTAPARGADTPIRLVAMGDLGKNEPDQHAVLEQVMGVEHDLALITGDLAYDNGSQPEIDAHYFSVYREVLGKVPWFVASGNHEYKTDDAEPFRDAFSLPDNGGPAGKERWYSFDWGRLHVAVLDTEKLVPEQVEWLDQDLAANDLPFTIVVAHRPPYATGLHGSHMGVREAFSPTLAKHGVKLALLGHEHHYERSKPQDGVTYVVAGGGGRGTRPAGESDFTAVSDRVAHFVYVEILEDTMRLVAVDATGQEFDSWAHTLP